jgi:hypothetical protein
MTAHSLGRSRNAFKFSAVTYDDSNNPFPRVAFELVRNEMTDQFGGVTAFLCSPAEGFWKEDDKSVRRDDVVIFEVMIEYLNRDWWARYRLELTHLFAQEELVVKGQHH